MKRRLSIVIVAFCVSFGLLIMLSLFSMERFSKFSAFSNEVDHSGMVIITIRSAEVSLRDMGLSERGYMITEDTMYLRFLNNAIDSINQAITTIKDLTADNKEQQKNVVMLKAAVALRIAAIRENVAYVDTSHSSSRSRYYDESRQMLRDCADKLRVMRLAENKLLEERTKDEVFYQKLTNDTLRSLLFIFCAITLFLFAVMIKELRSRMLFQEELQAKIIDLKRSHNELQEIAHAASHDLQEPLRKIQVFCDLLATQKNGDPVGNQEILDRISRSAARMQLLISDLMSLTSLTNIEGQKKKIDLHTIVKSVLGEVATRVEQKEASVEIQALPEINGYDAQLSILFKALIDNSLKFTREGVKPVITISCDVMTGHELTEVNPNLMHKKFYRITVADNGIGFENQFISKIFRIFQRLHGPESDYAGKGIGLAICQRIMANHEGYIIAHGAPQMGAKFKLFFPVDS